MSTLIAAAIASVVAATLVSRFWQAGTIMATAMTPVIVALVKEAVERPARRVSSIATRAAAPPVARASRRVVAPPPEAYAPPPPVVGPDDELSEMRVYRRERTMGGRRWKLAVATGLLACVIAVAAMTLPELVAGRSVVSGSHHTTIFGGHRSASSTKTKSTDTTTSKSDEQKSTSTATQPQDTTTQPDTTTTAPGQTTPAPQSQTQPQSTAPPATTQPPAQTQPTTPPAQQPPATTP